MGFQPQPPAHSQLRVLIVDPDAVFRLGVSTLLSSHPRMEVVGDAAEATEAIALVERRTPALLYLDWQIAVADDGWVLRRLQAMNAGCRTIVGAQTFSPADLGQALHLGVRGVLTKQAIVESLVVCLERVAAGEYFVAPGETTANVRAWHHPAAGGAALSRREIEIVNRVVEGASNKQVAGELGISEQTVKNLLRRVFQKLGVDNRVTLTLRTLGMGVTSRAHGGHSQSLE